MQSGIISLQNIYTFIDLVGDYKRTLPNTSLLGRSFAKLCAEITKNVPTEKGFYLWGNYNSKKFWTNIYLGKAGFGKTANLRNRILEELKDERCCFWRTKHTEEALLLLCENEYPKYYRETKRSLRKANTTHIAYVPHPEINEDDGERVESDLIESLNPISNKKRPVPPAFLNKDTAKIFHQLREQIHGARANGFIIKMK